MSDIITPLLAAYKQGVVDNPDGSFTIHAWDGTSTTYPGSKRGTTGSIGGRGSIALPPGQLRPLDPKGPGVKIIPLIPGGGFRVRPGTPPPLDNVKAPYAPPLPAGGGVAGGWGPPQDPAGNAYNPTLDGLNRVTGIFGGSPAALANGVGVAAGAGADALGLGAFGETLTNDINAAKLSAANSLKVIGVELLFLTVFVVAVVVFMSQTDAGQAVMATGKQGIKDAATAVVPA